MQRRREQPANFGRPKVEPSTDSAVTRSREVRSWLLDSSVGLISYRTAAGSPGKRVRRVRVDADVPSRALSGPGLIRSNPLRTPDRAGHKSDQLYKGITKPSSRSTSTIKRGRKSGLGTHRKSFRHLVRIIKQLLAAELAIRVLFWLGTLIKRRANHARSAMVMHRDSTRQPLQPSSPVAVSALHRRARLLRNDCNNL